VGTFVKNRRKPDPIAYQLVNSISKFDDIKYFSDNIFPPGLIFFDEKLSEEQTEIFINKIKMQGIKGIERFSLKQSFKKIALEMCSVNNIIRIFVSDSYSHEYMPGYLTIPFNFEFKDLIEYYEENKNEIFRIKKRVRK